MKKTALVTLILIFFVYSSSHGQTDPAHEEYIKATTAPTLPQKIKLLKEYLNKYNGKGSQYENYANAHLCFYTSQSNKLSEAIEYGEKAITMSGLDDFTKSQLYITLSSIYAKQATNLEKAKNYALQAVEIARVNKDKKSSTTTPAQWIQLMGAGYYIHAQTQEKAKQLKGAASSYIKSYDFLKNPQIGKDLKKVGKSLYNFKFYSNAEEAFRVAYNILNDYESCSYYAKSLFKNKKRDEALTYFKKAYQKKKSGEIAYNIGIILAGNSKKNPNTSTEAIKYLLEASFLSPSNSKKARSLAESIFFNSKEAFGYNEKVKELIELNKQLVETTELFNESFGDKSEEELSEKQKKEIESWQADIEALQEKIKKLEAEQKVIVNKFNKLLEDTKKRLGSK
ncbi:MAG: hypothetical protein ACETWK_03160 [Candidatus Aminicenantaceae bacterium]